MGIRGRRYGDLSEEELVRLFTQDEDQEAFAELFKRHSRNVFLACHAFFSDRALAQDATQETFLRAFQNKHQFHEGEYLRWLRRIARNVCIDLWRRKRPEVSIEGSEDGSPMELTNPEPDEKTKLAAHQLRREIEKLPADQRRCVELKIEGCSYEETAAKTGLTVEAVRSHLQNGRRTLRLRMQGVFAI
jgi:RNA polymerase sigma-70 factor, ECF subfamily